MSLSEAMLGVLSEVGRERIRQDAKFPGQTLPDGTGPDVYWAECWYNTSNRDLASLLRAECKRAARAGTLTWLDVLAEEFAEATAEADFAKLRTELIQVAAVAVRWVEDIDRRDPS